MTTTQNADVYDLQFTLIGTYSSIIEFLYDIEDDEELNFAPKNFTLTSNINGTTENTTQNGSSSLENNTIQTNNAVQTNTTSQPSATNKTVTTTQNSTTTENDGINLKATFTVENIGITLD